MLKLFGSIINIFLIVVISLRIPKENIGLTSFATKNEILGSPNSMQRSLNILTTISVALYIFIAIQLNFMEKLFN